MEEVLTRLGSLRFEVGPIRPPSEGGSSSLLLRFTCNCPWNQCLFCYGSPYGRRKFVYREVREIKKDIDAVQGIVDGLRKLSWKLGYGGDFADSVIRYVADRVFPSNFDNILMVWNWLKAGGKSVFIQDADSMIMHSVDLIEALEYLMEKFPQIDRITTYARSRTVAKKSLSQLEELRAAGLSRLHIGLESGDSAILKEMKKGATPEDHIKAGTKAKKAGFEVSEYIIPGLGGRDKSEQHAKNTAMVINKIGPHYVRSRPLVPRLGTPLYKMWEEGRFTLLSPHELLNELKLMVEHMSFTGRLCFDHMRNPSYLAPGREYRPLLSQDYEGYKFPEQKQEVLEIIDKGLSIPEDYFLSVDQILAYEKDIYCLGNA